MRHASIDILRTVAIAVMVFVHFGENLAGVTPPMAGFGAPLFVFLSGANYFLWSDALLARGTSEEQLSKVSVRRGLFVFGAGFVFNFFLWLPEGIFNWDVLTFIGTGLLMLNITRRFPRSLTIGLALMALLIAPLLRAIVDYPAYWTNGDFEYELTFSDVVAGFFAAGFFPIFPWIAFTLIGYATASWLFARPVRGVVQTPSVWRPAQIGVVLMASAVGILLVRPYLPEALSNDLFGRWSKVPPSTVYVLGSLGIAMGLLSLVHQFVDLNPASQRFRRSLGVAQTFSRYSLTIYIVHHIVHLWPLWAYSVIHGGDATDLWGQALPFTTSMALSVLFLAVCWVVLHALGPKRSIGFERLMRWVCD